MPSTTSQDTTETTETTIAFTDNTISSLSEHNYEFANCYSIFMENCSCVTVLAQEQKTDKDMISQLMLSVTIPPEINNILWVFAHSVLDAVSSHHGLSSKYGAHPETQLFFQPSKLILKSKYNENLSVLKDPSRFGIIKGKNFNASIEWKKFHCTVEDEYITIVPHFELIEIELVDMLSVGRHYMMPVHISVMDIIKAQTPVISTLETPIRDKLDGNFYVFMRLSDV